MPLALNIAAAAIPEASLPTVTVFDPLAANAPLAPLAGALNVTGTPASGVVSGQPLVLPSATWRLAANGASSTAVCGLPPASVNVFGAFEAGHAGFGTLSAVARAGRRMASPAPTARTAYKQPE